MKVSPSSFLSLLETGLVPISELRKRQKGTTDSANLVAIVFTPTGITVEYNSLSLCFVSSITTDNSTTISQTRIQVHLSDLVNLLRCCCESNDAVEIEDSEEVVFFKAGDNFEAEIQGVVSNISQIDSIDFGTPIVRFLADSDLLFSAFHQFQISPIPQKIVLSINSSIVITNTESDQAEYPLCSRAEIGRQFLSDFSGPPEITCTISGQNISAICSFLSVDSKIHVDISSNSWLSFRHHQSILRVYVSSL